MSVESLASKILSTFTPEQIQALYAELEAGEEYQRTNRIHLYYPDTDQVGPYGRFPARHRYFRQMEFFAAGKHVPFRMLLGGNGVAKTEGCGSYETAWHLRGEYPDWWPGHRFDRPIDACIAGETSETTRDIQQTKLLGRPHQEGTGLIPRDWIDLDTIARTSPAGCIDTFRVRHVSGGWSYAEFKSYKQGVSSFFGTEKDWFWGDEITPVDIFAELVARTRNRPGARGIVTFTPKTGATELVKLFRDKPDPTRILIKIGWDSAPHLDEEYKRNIIASTPANLLPAVRDGEPTQGAGAVYPVEESKYVIDPFPIPKHFRWVVGFDGGFFHTAAVWIAYDLDTDTAYVVEDYCDGGVDPNSGAIDVPVHVTRFLTKNKALCKFNPPYVGDAAARNQTDGKQTRAEYAKHSQKQIQIRMPDKAVEAGIGNVLARLTSGRLKVFRNCQGLIQEMRDYHYEYDPETQVATVKKQSDHRCDAMRYACMSGLKIAQQATQASIHIPKVTFG